MTQNKRTVLVIDDDTDFLIQVRMQLEAAGFNVREANGETEAEKALADFRPDLVIVDLMMEHFDGGFTLCHHIKKKDPTIPVIMATAVASATGIQFEDRADEKRKWIKADALLSKPLRFEQIMREINRLLPPAVK